jgi:hypothetical protein
MLYTMLALFGIYICHFLCAILPIWHTDMAVQHSRLQFDMQWSILESRDNVVREYGIMPSSIVHYTCIL